MIQLVYVLYQQWCSLDSLSSFWNCHRRTEVYFTCSTESLGVVYLAEEIELLVQRRADLYKSSWARLRLVWADCSYPDVAQISNIQCAIGAHGQRGGGFETSVTSVASIT